MPHFRGCSSIYDVFCLYDSMEGKGIMADQFIYCPTCGSDKLENAGFEDEDGEDSEELECECGWTGFPEELVCK